MTGGGEFSSLHNYCLIVIVVKVQGGQGDKMFVVHHASMLSDKIFGQLMVLREMALNFIDNRARHNWTAW